MRTRVSLSLASLLALAAAGACSSAGPIGFANDAGTSSGGGSGSGGGGNGSGSGGSGSGGSLLGGGGGDGGGGTSADGGFVCAPNPANYDIPGNNCDDDGNGKTDDKPACDTGLPATGGTATQFMNALGICQNADTTHWGIVSATYTNSHMNGTPGGGQFTAQYGILPTFGSVLVPREGASFGVLSSGSATVMDSDNGPYFKGQKTGMQGLLGNGDVPTGFPKQTAMCPTLAIGVFDVIDVKVQIKVPANAKGLSFDFDFHSSEWPEYVCNSYNDSFIAFLSSQAFNSGTADNVSFDTNGNPISVNANFFQVCTPGVETGCAAGGTKGTSMCTLGEAQLAGTGFAAETPEKNYCASGKGGGTGGSPSTSGGATSWLTSTAPLKPAETMTIEFIIWDTGDASWDSSVLIDNWVWQPQEVAAVPITQPSPPPK